MAFDAWVTSLNRNVTGFVPISEPRFEYRRDPTQVAFNVLKDRVVSKKNTR